jgi:hypothetical protein
MKYFIIVLIVLIVAFIAWFYLTPPTFKFESYDAATKKIKFKYAGKRIEATLPVIALISSPEALKSAVLTVPSNQSKYTLGVVSNGPNAVFNFLKSGVVYKTLTV